MGKHRRIQKLLRNPFIIVFSLTRCGMFRWMDDSSYLKMMYWCVFHKKMDLDNPKTYNEKLQWLKIHDHNPQYPRMVDKYEAKHYVGETLGYEIIIPTLGVWDRFEEIDFSTLPNQFVLKCTHDSGGLVICKDKATFNYEEAKRKINKCLRYNFYWQGREWAYKELIPRIIAEKYMESDDASDNSLTDYKVMCFNGVPKLIEVHQGRYTDHQTQDFYDISWHKTGITQGKNESYGSSNRDLPVPITLEQMLDFSKILSKGIAHVRVDWYSVNGRLYFGELTFFDGSGFVPYDNPDDDLMLGDWIDLNIVRG